MIRVNFEQKLPLDGDIVLVFLGASTTHEVAAERLSQCTITATIPGTVMIPSSPVMYLFSLLLLSLSLLSCSPFSPPSLLPLPSFALAHSITEDVQLMVCLNQNGCRCTLFQSHFTYTVDEKCYLAELLVQSVADSGIPIYCVFPPLLNVDALREFDQSLTEALKSTQLPEGWSLVGCNLELKKAVEGKAREKDSAHPSFIHPFPIFHSFFSP